MLALEIFGLGAYQCGRIIGYGQGFKLLFEVGLKMISVMTDSRTVRSCIRNIIGMENKVKSKGISEMIVKRRLGIIREIINKFGIVLKVKLVKTVEYG